MSKEIEIKEILKSGYTLFGITIGDLGEACDRLEKTKEEREEVIVKENERENSEGSDERDYHDEGRDY